MSENLETKFQPLYRVARVLALVMLVIIPLQVVIYVISPPPGTVEGYYALYHHNPFLGLLSLDFLYLFSNMIVIIIYLALFTLLYQERPVTVLLALVLGLIGIACYYPSNPCFEMWTLSKEYFQALPENQSLYLAAGEMLLSGYSGTTFNVYYVLSTICLLLFAYTLIKSPRFKKSVGLWGLISGFFMIIPSSAGTIGMIFSLLSLIPWLVFVALLSTYFRRFSQETSRVG